MTRDFWAFARGYLFAFLLFMVFEGIIGYHGSLFGKYGVGGVIAAAVEVAASFYLGRYHEKKVVARKNGSMAS